MKIRNGFVSNSSSQSFIVVGTKPPDSVEHARLNAATAQKVIASCIAENESWKNDDAEIEKLKAIDPTKQKIWLTRFLSDSGNYTEPLEDANMEFYSYQDGGHGGPYNEERYVNIGTDGLYEGVWVNNEDYVPYLPPKGQLELNFEED